MNDELLSGPAGDRTHREGAAGAQPPEHQTLGSSTLYKLCEEVISLRERNNRQHQEFERRVGKVSDDLKTSFNSFAADTQRAYQQMRQEFQGEKQLTMNVLNELLEISIEMDHIVASRPRADDAEAQKGWAEAVEVQARKVQAALLRHGIHPYSPQPGEPYTPALHERVGKATVDGMGPNLVAEVREAGYASQLYAAQKPGFILRRARVLVSE